MTLDAEMRDLAVDLAEELGKSVTVEEVTGSEYDPSAGTTVETTEAHDVHAAPPVAFSVQQLDSSVVQVGDQQLSIPAASLAFEPTTDDRVLMDGETWQIKRVEPTYSGEQVALYTLHLRR